MAEPTTSNGWLKLIYKKQEKMDDDITVIKCEIAALKVKAGIWGLLGGAIPTSVVLAVWIIRTL